MRFDRNGVALANVPNSGGVTQSGVGSGNRNHDSGSGKFTTGRRGKDRITPPANVDPLEYARMLDAVRDAAREFDTFDEGDIREFVRGRATSPDTVDIQQFMRLVQQQRLNDVIDLVDQTMRSDGSLRRGRRKLRISAPAGYARRSIGRLETGQLTEVMHRLEAMGHSRDDIDRFFSSRSKNHAAARGSDASVTASDQSWVAPECSREPYDEIELADEHEPPITVVINAVSDSGEIDANALANQISFELKKSLSR